MMIYPKASWDSLDSILKEIELASWGMVAADELSDRVRLHREVVRLAAKARLTMIRECKQCKLEKL